uniref:BED-type domain-containing protein n=1 Tax=Populus trichocarpa TaxID=3694 RepID=A0A3N7FA86_POPTR|eukprot:XP_024447921.1 uncharacterized protein LOC112325500 [Populus trichocarpa]
MEGVPPSCNEDDVNLTSNQFDFQSPEDSFNISEFLLPADNQGSISCNDQGGQTTDQFPPSFPQTMTTMGDLDGTSSSWINQNEPNWPQAPSRDQQWTDYQLPIMSNQVPAMNQWHQNSNIPQPYPRHGYITPNATTSQHGGFNQPGPSFPAPRIQHFPNQGQVDQAFAIPNIDNMQQENFVPQNFDNSTRSQMDNLQVRGLQNQTATPNASNPGLGTSLQSQNRGLNTQQVEMVRSKDPFWNYIEDRTDGSMKCTFCPHTFANKTSISRIKWHLSGEEGHNVAICLGVPKEVQEAAFLAAYKRQKITASSANVNDCGISTCPQEQNIEINMVGVGEQRISSQQ